MYSLYIYSTHGNYETPAQYTHKQVNELWQYLDSINVDATIINR